MISFRSFVLVLVVLAISCGGGAPAHSGQGQQTVILVAFDGFRWDYLDKANTPRMDELVANGVQAKSLIPVFPTKTFPNHYSLVSGLYSESHGILANNVYDPDMDEMFTLRNREAVGDGRWWGGEPIWVTGIKAGQPAATLFWPGSEAEIAGYRPSFWKHYDGAMSPRDRVEQVLQWLELPDSQRPTFVCVYFSDTDDAGHSFGPDSAEVVTTVEEMDEVIGWLVDGIKTRAPEIQANVILTADHGMTSLSPERVVFLDDAIDLSRVRMVDWNPVAAIRPEAGYEDQAYEGLKQLNNVQVYRIADVPERLRYKNNPRAPGLIVIADEGWTLTNRDSFGSQGWRVWGTHGYDPSLESMHGVFVAHGPAFEQGLQTQSVHNVDLYNLMTRILGIQPAQNDGEFDRIRHLLKPEFR